MSGLDGELRLLGEGSNNGEKDQKEDSHGVLSAARPRSVRKGSAFPAGSLRDFPEAQPRGKSGGCDGKAEPFRTGCGRAALPQFTGFLIDVFNSTGTARLNLKRNRLKCPQT